MEWLVVGVVAVFVLAFLVQSVAKFGDRVRGTSRTVLTISAEFPGMDESSVDVGRLRTLMERSALNIKRLAESEP